MEQTTLQGFTAVIWAIIRFLGIFIYTFNSIGVCN